MFTSRIDPHHQQQQQQRSGPSSSSSTSAGGAGRQAAAEQPAPSCRSSIRSHSSSSKQQPSLWAAAPAAAECCRTAGPGQKRVRWTRSSCGLEHCGVSCGGQRRRSTVGVAHPDSQPGRFRCACFWRWWWWWSLGCRCLCAGVGCTALPARMRTSNPVLPLPLFPSVHAIHACAVCVHGCMPPRLTCGDECQPHPPSAPAFPAASICCCWRCCCSCRPAGAQVAAQSAWAGLAAGFLHTLCGPDHLAVSATRGPACSAWHPRPPGHAHHPVVA